ncbi:MAG: SDR family NAD(P)-dependent oxidoreductase [Chloroflexi bacterium]|nr:SDR family NAD(P)-dependent oxidoreductase [Chloroflexota bacterium]
MAKNAIVWGASGAIGRAFVNQLAADGWKVLGVSRHPEDLADLTDHRLTADVADPGRVREAVHAAGMTLKSLDLYVYAAGDITSVPVREMEPHDWHRILNANFSGAYLTTHHSLKLLNEGAHVVYIGAVSERLRLPGLSAYGAAKVALEAFADALKKEERKLNVLVVRPGAVDTDFWEKVPMSKPKSALSPEDVAQRTLEAIANGEKGTLDL